MIEGVTDSHAIAIDLDDPQGLTQLAALAQKSSQTSLKQLAIHIKPSATADCVKAVAQTLSSFKLTHFLIQIDNIVDEQDLATIFENLDYKQLQALCVATNLTVGSFEALMALVRKAPKLDSLSLAQTHLTSEQFMLLKASLMKAQQQHACLQKLFLEFMGLRDPQKAQLLACLQLTETNLQDDEKLNHVNPLLEQPTQLAPSAEPSLAILDAKEPNMAYCLNEEFPLITRNPALLTLQQNHLEKSKSLKTITQEGDGQEETLDPEIDNILAEFKERIRTLNLN